MTLSKAEKEVLHHHLQQAKHYLEFGAGESTAFAVTCLNLARIDSVESSQAFIDEALLSKPEIQSAIEDKRLFIHHHGLGEIERWGRPKNQRARHMWPAYSQAVFDQEIPYDLVLIDGRFRVACALSAILHTPKECVIMVHDYANRTRYHLLEDFLDAERRVDKLAVFKKRPDVDQSRIRALIEKYQYRPNDKTVSQSLGNLFTDLRIRLRQRKAQKTA